MHLYISEKNKSIFEDANKMRPNYMSEAEYIAQAVDGYNKSHKKIDNELKSLDVPIITDAHGQFERYFKALETLKLADLRDKVKHILNLAEHELRKR